MILVTGATGMLGAHLLYELVIKGDKVRALKRSKSNLEVVKRIFGYYNPDFETIFSQIEWFEADILDAERIYQSMDGIDKIYHTAAMVSFNPKDKESMIRNNVKGTANVVNAALENNISKLCYVSSISALGNSEKDNMISENTFRNPKGRYSGYSLSKFYSELEVWRGITEGLKAVVVNPSIILGPGNWNSGSPGIFSTVYKGLKFYTEGITGYVDVLDVTKSMMQLMECDISGERFIVSSENLSFNDIFSKIAEKIEVGKPRFKATVGMLAIAWRLEYLKSLITSRPPLLTKDIVYSALDTNLYSSKKLIEAINFTYLPIDKSVNRIAELFKKDKSL